MVKTPPMKRIGSVAFTIGLLCALGCEGPIPEPEPGQKPSAQPEIPDPAELIQEDLKVGEGDRTVKDGDKLKVHYVGRLLRGNVKFDSAEGEKTLPFTVGGDVIDGWNQGVIGMKVGGKRKLTIPSRLAYKEAGRPPKIPPNAPLVFEIELVAFDDAPAGSASAGPSGSAKAEPAPTSSAKATPATTAKPKATAAPKGTSAP
jgi:FKBP-type peptidyl-prolyl cis-trans isomerase FkpA